MRFDLRLHGRTADGQKCRADVSVYANSEKQLKREALRASENAAWHAVGGAEAWVPEGAHITVEHVELLKRGGKKDPPPG